MRNFVLIILLLSMAGCMPTKEVKLDAQDLSFTAQVSEKPSPLSRGDYKVTGTLHIKNKSNSPVMYSNKDLFLVIKNE